MTIEESSPAVPKLAGVVLDANEEPIIEADVVVRRIIGKDKTYYVGSQRTDENGRFCFGGLHCGTYIVGTGARGFNAVLTTVKLQPKNRSIRLRKIKILQPVGT